MAIDSSSFLRFELQGAEDVDFGVFAKTSVDLDTLLRRITERRAGQDAHWRFLAAPVIHISASANGVSAAALESVVSDTYSAVAATLSDDPTAWPETFEPADRKITRRMVRRLRETAPVAVEATNEDRLLLPASSDRTRTLRPVFAAWSTVEGRLRALSDHPAPQFVIYEQGTDNAVRCAISPSRYDEVYRYFRQVVRVHGFVYYRANGLASSVTEVGEIEPLTPPTRALTEFLGALPGMTGGVNPGEYIRRIRAGGDE